MADDNKNLTPEEENDLVSLTLEDGTELVCDILAIFPYKDNEYIALVPTSGETEIYLYRFIDKGDDDIELLDIEDDDEFDAVSEAFDELMDAQEFDEMFGDDE